MQEEIISEENFCEAVNKDLPQIRISRNDLAKPTRAFVVNYYSVMLEQVTRMKIQQICDLTDEQREYIRNSPEGRTLGDHANYHNLFATVKYIFDQIQNAQSIQFHYSDFFLPQLSPKRSAVFMRLMYGFFTTCARFDEHCDIDLIDEKKALKHQLLQAQEQLKQNIVLQEEKKRSYLQGDNELRKELVICSNSREELQEKIREKQEEEQLLADELQIEQKQEEKLQEEFCKVEGEIKYFESLKVNDDGQITDAVSILTKNKESCFEKLRNLERQVQDVSKKQNIFDSVLSSYGSLNEVLSDDSAADKDLKKLKNMTNEIKKQLAVYEKEEVDLQGLVTEREESLSSLEKDLHQCEAKLTRMTNELKEDVDKSRATLRDLQSAVSKYTDRIKEVDVQEAIKKSDELSALIAGLEGKLTECNEEFKTSYRRMEAVREQLLSQLFKPID